MHDRVYWNHFIQTESTSVCRTLFIRNFTLFSKRKALNEKKTDASERKKRNIIVCMKSAIFHLSSAGDRRGNSLRIFGIIPFLMKVFFLKNFMKSVCFFCILFYFLLLLVGIRNSDAMKFHVQCLLVLLYA